MPRMVVVSVPFEGCMLMYKIELSPRQLISFLSFSILNSAEHAYQTILNRLPLVTILHIFS